MSSRLTIAAVTGGFALVLAGTIVSDVSLEARLIDRPQATTSTWKTMTETDVGSGATIPASKHVFFHVPVSIETIDREVLLGQRGHDVRYWGYCFPDPSDPANPPQGVGFPGKIFLSEAERAFRRAAEDRRNIFSPFQPPSTMPREMAAVSAVRHQIDVFRGGMTCYIMSQRELPVGTDEDRDGMNSKLEKQFKTDLKNPDSDGDGLSDGNEIRWATDPLRRDTDNDAIIDGIEDANQNGRLDAGETDPRIRDSDGDGLCDGLCKEFKVRKICKDNKGTDCKEIPYGQPMGEDKNFNGKIDVPETDPRKADSLGDGIRDDARYYKCLLDGKKDC